AQFQQGDVWLKQESSTSFATRKSSGKARRGQGACVLLQFALLLKETERDRSGKGKFVPLGVPRPNERAASHGSKVLIGPTKIRQFAGAKSWETKDYPLLGG